MASTDADAPRKHPCADTWEALDAWDHARDDEDRFIDRLIKYDDLRKNDQIVGAEWSKAIEWQAIDAMTWIAHRDPDLMKLVFGYRSMMRRLGLASEEVERACRFAIIPHLGSDLIEAELRLVSALGDGPTYASAAVIGEWPAENCMGVENQQAAVVRDTPLKTWVRASLDAGMSCRETIKASKFSFPQHQVPSKRRVEDAYRTMFKADFGEEMQNGSVHPLLKARRPQTAD